MTIEKALEEKYGVDYRKAYLNGEITHEEYYGIVIDFLGGIDAVVNYVPFDIETLKKSYHEDEHFNTRTTPLKRWGMGAENIRYLYYKFGINCASVSDGVCILKETARLMVKREENT